MIGLVFTSLSFAAPLAEVPATVGAPITLDGQARSIDAVESAKYLDYSVGVVIPAAPEVVWSVLTDASGYARWNSTVTSLEGDVAPGGHLELRIKADAKRTFELEVSNYEAARSMVWEDGNKSFRGRRLFTLAPTPDGGTAFTMREVFTGKMMKMIAPHLPDFRADFEAFAADLARESERRATSGS